MGQGLADTCTLRSWLSMWSLSTSQCRARPHLERIHDPALVVEATDDRGCYPSDAAQISHDLGSTDKQRAVLTADHYLRHPPDLRDRTADLVAGWLGEHKW